MHSNHSSSKDFRIKYASLASLGRGKSEEEFLVAENVLKLELSICQESLRKEKLKVKQLIDENHLYSVKYKELENHAKTLSVVIKDKDSLINKLWDEVLALKKQNVMHESHTSTKPDFESDISAEGEVGVMANSVGRSITSSFAPNFTKKRQYENDEITKLRNEFQDSEDNYRILNERMKDLTEIYSKLEIEVQDFKESLKFEKENSVLLTQQILRISHEKENSLIEAYRANDEVGKKLEMCEFEKRKLEKELRTENKELKEELAKEKVINKNFRAEVHILKEESAELKGEIREYVKIIKQKDSDVKSLTDELEEAVFKSIKANVVRTDFTSSFNENTKVKSKIIDEKQEIKSSSENPFRNLVIDENFRYDSITRINLIQTFGSDSRIFFEKIQKILKTKKKKIRNLKQKVESLTEELNKKPREVEVFYSSYTDRRHIDERQSKDVVESETVYFDVERLKMRLEKHKIAKRKVRAEKEQAKEDLAHAILEISEISSELFQYKLKVDECDYLAFLVTEAQMFENSLLNNS